VVYGGGGVVLHVMEYGLSVYVFTHVSKYVQEDRRGKISLNFFWTNISNWF